MAPELVNRQSGFPSALGYSCSLSFACSRWYSVCISMESLNGHIRNLSINDSSFQIWRLLHLSNAPWMLYEVNGTIRKGKNSFTALGMLDGVEELWREKVRLIALSVLKKISVTSPPSLYFMEFCNSGTN